MRLIDKLIFTPFYFIYIQYKLSGWQDLNLRPPVPKTGALPDCATPCGGIYRISSIYNKRVMGIEPISAAWKADNLPLIYTRKRNQANNGT